MMPHMEATNGWPSNPAEVATASSTLFEHAVEIPAASKDSKLPDKVARSAPDMAEVHNSLA